MNQEFTWKILDKYFSENPTALVSHHLESYDEFFESGIKKIIKEKNPIKILKVQDPETKNYKLTANIYIAGKNTDKLYFGKPIIYDEDRIHYMYPNEARLRNMTYATTVHYDVEVDFRMEDEDSNVLEKTVLLEKVLLGRFPIMLRSKLCILNGFDKNVRFTMGECRNDLGGYFIIDGKEKVVISQEKFADNMLYIRDNVNSLYSHSAEIRTVSEDSSKPIRTLAIRIVSPTSKLTNNQIVVNVPNVRKPVPLFILMRALGIISDKSIIECCLLDLEKYNNFIDLFIPSIHDASKIFTQEVALKYIATFTKGKTIAHVLDILCNYFLPNIGETNFRDKALFLGYMVLELLMVFTNIKKPTDRDSFKYKRVELAGELLYDLFREYYTLQLRNIYQKIDKEYYYKQGIYQTNFVSLIENNHKDFFREKIVESGFRKGFKGNWGAEEHTKRVGVVQDIIRLSFNSYISIMRKINLPLDSSAKVVGPRLLHSSQWGIIDPVDTPDGGNIGLHKHMSIMAKISKKCSGKPIIEWLRKNTNILVLAECEYKFLSIACKIIVNGAWIGVVTNPEEIYYFLINYRRNALISIYTSISWDIKNNIIFIYTDSGRMSHPVYYIDKMSNKLSIDNEMIIDKINENNFTWSQLISGFNSKKLDLNNNYCQVFNKITDLYEENSLDKLRDKQAIIEYIDTAESEGALISININDLSKKNYTHMEIDSSILLGVMGNQIIFPENNPLPRDLFSCGQSKQAISIYHTNYLSRFDKMGVVLHYGQLPIVKSRYLKYINNEEHAYGINVIVAISCYGGYNVEDSILFNKGSLDRGLFRNTYYNTYESFEESSKVASSTIDSRFANIQKENVIGLKPGYDYADLDDAGLIKENQPLDDKKVLIGKVLTNLSNPNTVIDSSIFPKKGQAGYVDKTFITEGEEGFRIAKVRVRDDRKPVIGDKFCSRCGQKGTVGLVIPEESMPFTSEGIRPDIIINPHALPSRMTIGQLIETIMGKACLYYGSYADCTAFINKGSKYKIFGELLNKIGFSSSANEILYNGETGTQMQMDIFMGPTYYMRLKQLVKDKINYRARGPRTVLTRQTVQGRANDGGLRIGEMERDAVVGHGMTNFLNDSMLTRGDEYYMAICNLTGLIAIYNENLNLFVSPMADGPIKFTGEYVDKLKIEKMTKYGRSFSIVRVPYAFKLLLQELTTLNIQIRIITDENIDQIESMSFSNQIKDLENPQISSLSSISTMSQFSTATPIEDTGQPENPDENYTDKVSFDLPKPQLVEQTEGQQQGEQEGEQRQNEGTEGQQRQNEQTQGEQRQNEEEGEQTEDSDEEIEIPIKRRTDLTSNKDNLEDVTDKILPDSEQPNQPDQLDQPNQPEEQPEDQPEVVVVDDPNAPDTKENKEFPLITNLDKKDEENEDENKDGKKTISV